MTVPLLVIAAIVIVGVSGSGSGSGSGSAHTALDEPTPPQYAKQTANCTKVLEKLPIDLGSLTPRIVHTHPESPAVVAWGDPAVVLSCGVDRPKALHPGSSTQFFPGGNANHGPYFDITKGPAGNVWTSVDRAVYVSVSIPAKYQGSTVMPPLARAIGQALPAVCVAAETAGVPTSKLCAERK